LGRCLPIQIFLILLFQTSLLDWKCWKSNVKSCPGPLKRPPWGAKNAKKVLCCSGIKGKPDDFFSIPVTPIKIKNHEDSVLTTFFQDVTFLDQARFQQSRAKRADCCEPATLINHCSGDFLSFLSPPLKSKMIKICNVGRPCSYIGFAICQLSPKSVEKCTKKHHAETA
jgi:hypothetical protein